MSALKRESERARAIFDRLKPLALDWYPTVMSRHYGQPFKALISAMLSAQTREEQTTAASESLFALADTPAGVLALSDEQILSAISRVSYPGSKLGYLRDICARLVENGGEVPRTVDELIAYKGVGWKVATLTLLIAYGRDEDIPVDVHVHRIGIRQGFVTPDTKKPPSVNEQLKAILPRAIWAEWNPLMVQFGREVCQPRYPRCKVCPVYDLCPRIGV
jgi:endonuclease-3